jgi:tRNA(Ile)-lysidine synthase
MASSRKSKRNSPASLLDRVSGALRGVVETGDRLVLGLSGGIDSVVLLDILARLTPRLKYELSAVHVNHQLSPNAPRWARFCRTLCRTRGIPLRVTKVAVARRDSIEAAARAARHAVFGKLRADYVVLAHNQDDQAETLLLQLLRGAGVRGLAAMPRVGQLRTAVKPFVPSSSKPERPSGMLSVIRPLLDVPRKDIEAYARRRRLEWVEDESNAQTYFLRNFLRHEVFPLIARRYPAYRTTLSRSARHLAEAAALLDELAAADFAAHAENGGLAVAALRAYALPRAKNLLRYLISSHGIRAPSADRLDEALRQLLTAKQDARVQVELNGAQLRRFAGKVHVISDIRGDKRWVRRWRGESEIALPQLGGVLVLARGQQGGISLARLRGREVTIAVRAGGERLQPHGDRPRRSLKNLFQEARIPPWQRERLPLLFCEGDLVWAAGIGIDCAYRSDGSEPALHPAWHTV